MKNLTLTLLLTLTGLNAVVAQTVLWSNMSTNSGYPKTIPYGGGQTATVYYSSSATTQTTAPNDVVNFRAGTNSPDLEACGSVIANTFPGSTTGLYITQDYTSVAEAENGNYLHVTFSTPVCGVDFNLIDLTSPALTQNYPGNGIETYNDKVTITATDINNQELTPTLTQVGFGYADSFDNGCPVFWHANQEMPSDADNSDNARVISGNTAWVIGGEYISGIAGGNCFTGGVFNSMDINVDFGSVCVKKLIIQYYNDGTRLHANEGNCTNYTIAASQQPQSILIGNFSYTSLLPISLASFDGKIRDNVAKLKWTTLSEINNEGFDIMHSSDGIQYEKIGFVKGATNSSAEQYYTFDHLKPSRGNNYYHLVQRDLDGTTSNSNIITLKNGTNSYSIEQNPANNILNISSDFEDQLSLVDLYGREVRKINIISGKNAIDISDLSSGMYFIISQDGIKYKVIVE
jgi:hypothetical protein